MTKEIEAKPVEVRINGIIIQEFFDSRFIECLKSEFEEMNIQHFCLYIGESKKDDDSEKEETDKIKEDELELVSYGHAKPEDVGKKVLNIRCRHSDTLEKSLKVLKAFSEEKK